MRTEIKNNSYVYLNSLEIGNQLTCNELVIMNRYWNISALSLTANTPNNQLTPSTGNRVLRDRNPDLFKIVSNIHIGFFQVWIYMA
jgi:hypothetical protein